MNFKLLVHSGGLADEDEDEDGDEDEDEDGGHRLPSLRSLTISSQSHLTSNKSFQFHTLAEGIYLALPHACTFSFNN